mgnify:CR=1 FL=1
MALGVAFFIVVSFLVWAVSFRCCIFIIALIGYNVKGFEWEILVPSIGTHPTALGARMLSPLFPRRSFTSLPSLTDSRGSHLLGFAGLPLSRWLNSGYDRGVFTGFPSLTLWPYSITSSDACQEVFSTFFQVFFGVFPFPSWQVYNTIRRNESQELFFK